MTQTSEMSQYQKSCRMQANMGIPIATFDQYRQAQASLGYQIVPFDDVDAGEDLSGPPDAALAGQANGLADLTPLSNSPAIAEAIARVSATFAGMPAAGAADLTLSANSAAIAHATALANAAAAPGVPLADHPARAVAASNFAPTPKQAAAAPWEHIVDQVNDERGFAPRGQSLERLPVPAQKGAVSWSDIADARNAEALGHKFHERLPVPSQKGAVSWSDIADKLNAELKSAPASRRAGSGSVVREAEATRSHGQSGAPTQAGATSWTDIAAELNTEKGVKPTDRR